MFTQYFGFPIHFLLQEDLSHTLPWHHSACVVCCSLFCYPPGRCGALMIISLFYNGLKLGLVNCNCLWFWFFSFFFFFFLFLLVFLRICVLFAFWLSLRFSWTSINNCLWAITFCNELPYSQRCMSSGPVHWYTFMLFRLAFLFFFKPVLPHEYISQCFLYFMIKYYVACLVFTFFPPTWSIVMTKYINCKKNKCYGVIQINITGLLL